MVRRMMVWTRAVNALEGAIQRRMPNERARPQDVLPVRERDPLWTGEGEQGRVIGEHLLRLLGRKGGGVLQEIVFHLLRVFQSCGSPVRWLARTHTG